MIYLRGTLTYNSKISCFMMSYFCFTPHCKEHVSNLRHLKCMADLSAYRSVLRVCSQETLPGEMLAIMQVLEFPINESFKMWVSLL